MGILRWERKRNSAWQWDWWIWWGLILGEIFDWAAEGSPLKGLLRRYWERCAGRPL